MGNSIPAMKPDYPFKIFYDKRQNYVLLIHSLAEDSSRH